MMFVGFCEMIFSTSELIVGDSSVFSIFETQMTCYTTLNGELQTLIVHIYK